MFSLIKTYYTVVRTTGARVSEGMLARCKVCGLYFWDKQKAQEHKHEKKK